MTDRKFRNTDLRARGLLDLHVRSQVSSSTSHLDDKNYEYINSGIVNPLDWLPPCDNPRLILADIHGLYTPVIKEFPPNPDGTSTVPRLYPVNAHIQVNCAFEIMN